MLCVLGLLGAGWAVVSEIGRSPGPSAKAPETPPASPPLRLQPTRLVVPAVQTCTNAVARGDAAVARARVAIADWRAHVQAMVDQVSGKNTPEQTKKIWARTRARGVPGVTAFRAAQTDYQKLRDQCLDMPTEEVVPDTAATVATCRDVSRQADEVLAAGAAAVRDWEAHLKAMADREAGRLDPHHAWQTWLRAYKAARINIDKFTAADRVYQDHARCGPPG
jgi:hypothetical protein